MDLEYGPEYEAFRREVRSFLESHREKAPVRFLSQSGRPTDEVLAWQKLLLERGYTARTIPKQYGGYGAEPDLLARIILDEEFARSGLPPGLSGQGPDMLVPTLLEHGSEEQKRRYVPPTLRGEMVWCQGYSEPGSGSDLASLQTRGVDDGDDFLVSGQKIWTSSAHYSDMMFCLVRTEPGAERHAGISYLLIPMQTPGIRVRPLRTMTGGAEFNEVFFDDVRVPKANLVGKRGEGWRIANATLVHERNMLGSSSQLEAQLASLVRLMQHESEGGVAAMASPVFRDRLVRLQARVVAAKYHALRLLTCRLRGESAGIAQLVVKLTGCELAHQLNALALDVMGELGMLYHRSAYERDRGRWLFGYMFSLGLIIGGGTAQIQKNIISERGLGMPREPKAVGA
jgi:alkylation response protein AidB-like acyl-CoA dehydrogenase